MGLERKESDAHSTQMIEEFPKLNSHDKLRIWLILTYIIVAF